MNQRSTVLATLVALAVLGGCRKDKADAAREVLAKDTALASEVREIAADTTAYTEAADIAIATDPDSAKYRGTASIAPTMRTGGTKGAAAPVSAPPRTTPPPPARAPSPAPRVAAGTATPPSPPPPAATRIPEPSPATAVKPTPSELVTTSGDPCDSPATSEQRRCLLRYLARSDAGLDRTYQSLIAEMKRQAGAGAGQPQPETVQQLREAQRAWLVYRDTECRRRNRGSEGPLWAPTRATCLGQFSTAREVELAGALAKLRGQ